MCLVFGVRPTLTVKQTKGSEMTKQTVQVPVEWKMTESGSRILRRAEQLAAQGVDYHEALRIANKDERATARKRDADRIKVISSDPRAKDLTLRVIGKWADDQR